MILVYLCALFRVKKKRMEIFSIYKVSDQGYRCRIRNNSKERKDIGVMQTSVRKK